MTKKEFVKLTNSYTGRAVYIDLNNVVGVHDGPFNNYNNSTVAVNASIMCNGCHFEVTEHISEVLALIEGRDPAPSRVLFKGK